MKIGLGVCMHACMRGPPIFHIIMCDVGFWLLVWLVDISKGVELRSCNEIFFTVCVCVCVGVYGREGE